MAEIRNAETGRFIDESNIVDLIQVNLVTNHNVILRGETGTGKTYLVHCMTGKTTSQEDAAEMWKPYGLNVPTLDKFSCHEEQGYADIIAQDVLIGGETKVRRQILLKWLEPAKDDKSPKILLVDEANFLSPSVSGFLHPLCDWQNGIWVPELNEFVERSPLHWMVLNINPYEQRVYAGTKQMNAALAGRFSTIDVPYMTQSAEKKFIEERFPKMQKSIVNQLVAFAEKTRRVYKQDLLAVPITPRNLIQFCQAMELGDMSLDDIQPMILGVFPPDQHAQVKGLISGKTEKEVFNQVSA
jgi:MoxR-like ATPase